VLQAAVTPVDGSPIQKTVVTMFVFHGNWVSPVRGRVGAKTAGNCARAAAAGFWRITSPALSREAAEVTVAGPDFWLEIGLFLVRLGAATFGLDGTTVFARPDTAAGPTTVANASANNRHILPRRKRNGK
jgi:hypothetical protein